MAEQTTHNPPQEDRRQTIRMPYRTSLTYARQDETGKGMVRDISCEGLFLETRRAFAVGDQLRMDFRFRHGGMNMAITGEIAHTTPQGVGVRLIW
jgi:hypothetical protein